MSFWNINEDLLFKSGIWNILKHFISRIWCTFRFKDTTWLLILTQYSFTVLCLPCCQMRKKKNIFAFWIVVNDRDGSCSGCSWLTFGGNRWLTAICCSGHCHSQNVIFYILYLMMKVNYTFCHSFSLKKANLLEVQSSKLRVIPFAIGYSKRWKDEAAHEFTENRKLRSTVSFLNLYGISPPQPPCSTIYNETHWL